MNRRTFLKSTAASAVLVTIPAGLTGCKLTQSQYAQLADDIGTQVAAIVALQGNTDLANKITIATAAAVAAIKGWTPGTPSQNVIQAINALVTLLNLVPNVGPYIPLIQLALATVEILITDILNQSPALAADSHMVILHTKAVSSVQGAHNHKELKSRWNAICDANPAKLASVRIK